MYTYLNRIYKSQEYKFTNFDNFDFCSEIIKSKGKRINELTVTLVAFYLKSSMTILRNPI